MVGPDGWNWSWLSLLQNLVSRRQLDVKFTSSRTPPPQQWCDYCVKGRGVEHPHKHVTLERAESTLSVLAFDFCFLKVVPAAAKTVTDYLVEGVVVCSLNSSSEREPACVRRRTGDAGACREVEGASS